ncbi:MAG TPA: hypothetical protein VMS89_09510 [Methanoregulaceae archaeon]|nr:hypothetical protein [Methanoregulaceae archaeon]
MRIIRSVQSKVCVDGSLMKEFLLDEPLTEEFLSFLRNFGTISLFSPMKLPYFSFEKEDFISIKGFVGDPTVEVRYRKNFQDLTGDYFHLLLFYYRDGENGIEKLKGIEGSIRRNIDIRKDFPG